MKNRKEKLKESRLNTSVVLLNFRNIYIKHKEENKLNNYVYCFYEGIDDSKYYNHRIEAFCGREVSHLSTDGKDKLIRINQILQRRKSSYKNSKSLFFIDKDYDEFIKYSEFIKLQKISNLYITPTYSIENFYCSQQVFKKILQSEFNISETDEKFEKIRQLFLKLQNEFHTIMLDINTWIATQNHFLHTKEKRNIPYNELHLDKILKISLNKIEAKNGGIKFLENKFPEAFLLEKEDIKNKFDELKIILKNSNLSEVLRGKFEINFLNKFLKLLIEKSNQKDGQGLTFIDIHEKIKVKLVLNDTISNLTQYADTPTCLKDFCKNSML